MKENVFDNTSVFVGSSQRNDCVPQSSSFHLLKQVKMCLVQTHPFLLAQARLRSAIIRFSLALASENDCGGCSIVIDATVSSNTVD